MSTENEVDLIDPDQSPEEIEHVGCVFAIPDSWWGFEAVDRESHPGACVLKISGGRAFNVLKGGDATRRTRYYATEIILQPSDSNGLSKLTAFALKPRVFRRHQLNNLREDRRLGTLGDDDLNHLRTEMLRTFGTGRE